MGKLNGTAAENLDKPAAELQTQEEQEDDDDPRWGTWEELLLAFAVNRYGTNSWDSVAVEIQKRTSSDSPSTPLITPLNCRKKYLHLTRRFFARNGKNRDNGVASDNGTGAGSIVTTDESVPLLEELRNLRVAELRRELEHYDLSIVSLQSKVKQMKEERERSNSENRVENPSDLSSKMEAAKIEVKDEPEKSPPSVAGEPVSGKDEQSVNDSLSTDRRSNREETGTAGNVVESKPLVRTGEASEEQERAAEEKPVREEDSCYGSSDSVEKEETYPEPEPEPKPKPSQGQSGMKAEPEPAASEARNEVKVDPESVSGSPEPVESVAESKEGENGGRGVNVAATTASKEEEEEEECSDVQSSATKSRGDGDNDDSVLRWCRDHDNLENKDESAAEKVEVAVESQPLVDFLEELKRHKLGSVFMRRLDSQESPNYKKMIRQHIDLETVHARVKEGAYLDGNLKFFRDLLLLVNNAMVFFGKRTPEFLAASELRNLISSEMVRQNAKAGSSSLQKVSIPRKEASEPSESLLLKPKLGVPLIFCRKRSSIASKATASSSGSDRKEEQTSKLGGEKAGPADAKQLPRLQPQSKAEEPRITKKRSRDRFAPAPTNTKKNGKNGGNTNFKQTPSEKSQGKGGSFSQPSEPRSDNKNKHSGVDLKKRGATNFLNRMKQSSSFNNGPLLDALKGAPLTGGSSSRGTSENKRIETGKGSGRKEQFSTRVSDSKQAKEKGSPAKKTLGRPPKKGAASAAPSPSPPPPPPAPMPPASGKRSRDGRESEPVASKHQKKRSRK